MDDFEIDSDTDSELGPGQQEVLNTLIWIQEDDIVRFSPADNSAVFNCLIDSITRDEDGEYYHNTQFRSSTQGYFV